MLYRPAFGKGNMVWGARVDTKIVNSKREHGKAIFAFWITAHAAVRLSKALHFVTAFFITHSGAIVAAILALIVGIILFHYQENNKYQNKEPSQQESNYEFQTYIT
jgi:sugar phosphate permease